MQFLSCSTSLWRQNSPYPIPFLPNMRPVKPRKTSSASRIRAPVTYCVICRIKSSNQPSLCYPFLLKQRKNKHTSDFKKWILGSFVWEGTVNQASSIRWAQFRWSSTQTRGMRFRQHWKLQLHSTAYFKAWPDFCTL